jgi:hypothetical protein
MATTFTKATGETYQLVTVNCDAFIIPNGASKVDLSWSMGQDLANFCEKVAELNNLPYDKEQDLHLQLWLANDDNENIARHGLHLDVDGDKYVFHESKLEDLPVSFFQGYEEGDIVTIRVPMEPSYANIGGQRVEYREFAEDHVENIPKFLVTFNIKLNQKDYRYRRFGTFENTLAAVCR